MCVNRSVEKFVRQKIITGIILINLIKMLGEIKDKLTVYEIINSRKGSSTKTWCVECSSVLKKISGNIPIKRYWNPKENKKRLNFLHAVVL